MAGEQAEQVAGAACGLGSSWVAQRVAWALVAERTGVWAALAGLAREEERQGEEGSQAKREMGRKQGGLGRKQGRREVGRRPKGGYGLSPRQERTQIQI